MTNAKLVAEILGKLSDDMRAGWKSENGLFSRLADFIMGLKLDPTIPNDDLLDRLEEYLDDHSDVIDGDDGPIANTAMNLLSDLKQWRLRGVLPVNGSADNGTAWKLAEALNAAMSAPAGNPIDRGLATLRVFAEHGFRIVRA